MLRYLLFFMFARTIVFSQENKVYSACGGSMGSAMFDANNISTRVYAAGDLHWNIFTNGTAAYEFPKGSGKTLCNASHIWIGGLDGFGNLHVAAQTYRQSGNDFWSGPVSTVGAWSDYNTCQKYDRVWKLNVSDINNFVQNYNNGNVQNGSYTIPNEILTWPVIDTPDQNFRTNAQFVDVNHNGKYDPRNEGDYPLIKGDQSLFHIFNDYGGLHQASGSTGIGLQINRTVYGYNCASVTQQYPELANTTFYHYKVYNRGENSLQQVYLAAWSDGDIGTKTDDFVGGNPQLGYGFVYNGTNTDAVYGDKIPAIGTLILKAPLAPLSDGIDNDNDTIVDEIGEQVLTPRVMYYNHYEPIWGNNGPMSDPENGYQYYVYMKGIWKDGTPVTCGGTGYGGTVTAQSVFTGSNAINSNCNAGWTEKSVNNTPGNRCLLVSVGPFNINAGDSLEFEYAMIASIDTLISSDNIASTIQLEKDVKRIKQFYRTTNQSACFLEVGINDNYLDKNIFISPNPVESILTVKSNLFKEYSVSIVDLLGRVVYKSESDQITHSCDLSSLHGGIYLVNVSIDNKIITKKIVKQ